MRQGDTHLHEYQLDTRSKNRHLTITQCGCTDPETDAPSILTLKLLVLPPHPYAWHLSLLHSRALTAPQKWSPHSNAFTCSTPFISMHVLTTPLRAQTPTQYPNKVHPSALTGSGFTALASGNVLIAQLRSSLTLLGTYRPRSTIAAPQRLWRVETFLCLWRKGKAHQLLTYLSTHLPHYHLGQAWLLAAQLTNWSKLQKAIYYPAPSSCALLNNSFWLI